jgi:hypothetical protein
MDLSPHERFQKFRKQPRSRLKPNGVVCVPPVVEIKQRSSTAKQSTAPQVLLDAGWTIYFGDEIGIISSTPSHIHIRNILDGNIGIAIKTELFDCLLQGMLEIKKHI